MKHFIKSLSLSTFLTICVVSPSFANTNVSPSCFLPTQIAFPQEQENIISSKGIIEKDKYGNNIITSQNIPNVARHATPFNAQESVVEIVSKTPSGYATGSGVVVTPLKNILTAKHAITYTEHQNGKEIIKDVDKIAVLDSRGNIIGFAQPISSSEETRDMVVLKITSFARNGKEYLKNIPGLNVSPIQKSHQMSGVFSYPAGISQGASGAPAINYLGEVVGIVVKATTNIQSHGRIQVMRLAHTGNLVSTGNGTYTREDVKYPLPEHGIAYLEPILDSNIVNALGISTSAEDNNNPISVSIPSYPSRHCVIYKGEIR